MPGGKIVSEIISHAKADLRSQRPAPAYPDRGAGWNGVEPGRWEPDETGMPPDCPVKVLGMDGDILFVIDAMGQLAAVSDTGFGINRLQRLFGKHQNYIEWAWPRISEKGVTGLDMNRARGCFYTAADIRGLWNAVENVRGLGAWRGENNELIWNCGDALYVNGVARPTGEIGEYFYPARPKIDHPWPSPVEYEDNPALSIYRALCTWNWERPEIAPFLVLGSIGCMLLSGALPWRPSMFIVGDAAVGKSQLQYIINLSVGKALLSSADTTAAGIYQRVQMDARPVAIDELEAEADMRKVMAVVKLARLAASGALMLRGGAEHKGTEFQARSSFFFSSINSPVTNAADISRLAVMSLRKLDEKSSEKGPPEILNANEVPAKLMRRLIDAWPRFDELRIAYRQALGQGGHDSRGQDTYGAFLTCAHMLLGDEGVDELGFNVENFAEWGEKLAAWKMPEVSARTENWRSCLNHLLTSRVEAWRHGTRQTVGKAIEDIEVGITGGYSLHDCKRDLQQAGVSIEQNPALGEGFFLCIPNSGALVAKMFEGSKWAGSGDIGVWSGALRQGPPDIIMTNKRNNRSRINGIQQRCIKVSLEGLKRLERQEAVKDMEDDEG